MMTSLKQTMFLVTALVLVLFAVSSVSAFGAISSIEVNDVDASASNIATFAGESIPVTVVFDTTDDARNVRVEAWIVGDRTESIGSSGIFEVDAGNAYVKNLQVRVPHDFDEKLSEPRFLKVVVEARDVLDDDPRDPKIPRSIEKTVSLHTQRETFVIEVLDVDMPTQVKSGETLVLDVVLKNRGREQAEDTFVRASIPALGLADKGFFGDLSPVDQGGELVPDKSDSEERRLAFKIPANTPAGVYVVEVEAFNADTATTISRKVAIVSTGNDSIIVSPVTSKTFAVGQTESYSLTIANTGNTIAIYEFVVETPSGLDVEVSEPLVALPAGTSKTVQFMATADKDDNHEFAVNVHSDGQLVTTKQFSANVEENGKSTNPVTGTNATVLLTVVLAIVFIVLLVVLIVLLTRKPEKSEEFGESYY